MKIQTSARDAVLDRSSHLAVKGEICASSHTVQPFVFSGFFKFLQCKLRYLDKLTLILTSLHSNLSF